MRYTVQFLTNSPEAVTADTFTVDGHLTIFMNLIKDDTFGSRAVAAFPTEDIKSILSAKE